jgi:hypothetical protein
MPTVELTGKVLPSVMNIAVNDIPPVNWTAAEIGLTMCFALRIENSTVSVKCKLNRFNDADIHPIYIRALDLARGAVDLVAFAAGVGLTVTLDTFINPDGGSTPILLKDDRLSTLCTAFRINAPDGAFVHVLTLVLKEPSLFMALNDLITAITLPHHAPTNCARAIERLRNLIAPNRSRKNGWSDLRQSLQIDRNYLEFITTHSEGPRHGDPTHIPGTVTTEVTRRSWVIMNRFLEFRKRGGSPLSISEFPMLT